jgi:death on curing protein
MHCASSRAKVPIWVEKAVVLAIHEEQLAEHGGRRGIRDEAGVDSALSRPVNLSLYETNLDLCDLAAAYAAGLGQRQSFIDGNKRVSSVVTELFLNLNGFGLIATDAEIVSAWKSLAANKMSQEEMAAWIRTRIEPL